ncbi:DNA repair protein RecO [Thalassotalea sp. M1531]|uniref:DNA repair protein RecO n=1 Tax=Thalassotalea algicola TaxID=2716224 RepID=A0A7Y0L8X1_9GAMM|nr:DNA repair protein RecO [Thalassotalea algicola]NMP29962.1 DNA repair protein RecO [Thalassotalea algicola]
MIDIASPQSAFLLHSRPYQEHKLLVELLTEQEGKVAAVVYAGKTAKSNKKPLLQPFFPLKVQLKGKSQLKSLQSVEADGRSIPLVGSDLYCGFYLNELLVKLLPELIPCPELFKLYHQAIQQFNLAGSNEPALRHFELSLLSELGIGLNFEQALACQSDYVSFSFDEGFSESLKGKNAYLKSDVLLLANHQFNDQNALRTAKLLMRELINQLLGNKTLNSRKLFKKEKK